MTGTTDMIAEAREIAEQYPNSHLVAMLDDPETAERAARYVHLQEEYPGDYGHKYRGELYASVQGSFRDHGTFWIYLADEEQEALDKAGDTEGDWGPMVLVDLTTGRRWSIVMRAAKGALQP